MGFTKYDFEYKILKQAEFYKRRTINEPIYQGRTVQFNKKFPE